MRVLDLILRWHARRCYAQWQPQSGDAASPAETAAPKDNVYPLW